MMVRGRRTRIAGALAAIGLLTACDSPAQPTPDNYEKAVTFVSLTGDRSCGPVMPDGVEVPKPTRIFPRAGGDTVVLGGRFRLLIFDSASPRAWTSHDRVILNGALPEGYEFKRVGADLLICSRIYGQELLVVRHYCKGDSEDGWNNQIEQITFPQARETWVADELYNGRRAGDVYPTRDDLRNDFEIPEEALTTVLGAWKIKPFRDVLPSDWFAGRSCNKGL